VSTHTNLYIDLVVGKIFMYLKLK